MRRARIHIIILVSVLVVYGAYSIAASLRMMSWLYGIGGIYALVAGAGAAAGKRWSKPLVWTLGVIIIWEWLWYTIAAYRSGEWHPGSVGEFSIALVPGVVLACAVAYCCYVVNVYIARTRHPSV